MGDDAEGGGGVQQGYTLPGKLQYFAKIFNSRVKAHPDDFFDVSYDVHGKKVVKLRAPRSSLAIPQ